MRGERTALRRDERLLQQSYRALLRVSDWLNDLDTVSIDGRDRDRLGEMIQAVGEAEREVYAGLEDLDSDG
jgi:hypothetical protein